MTQHSTLLAAFGALALGAAGCAGDLVTGPGGDPAEADAGGGEPEADAGTPASTAQALFEANVHGILFATCSPGGACHSAQDPAFITADKSESYGRIKLQSDRLFPDFNPVTANLLLNGQNNHYTAEYDAADIEAIEAWLAVEKAESGDGPVVVSALAVWSGCMSLVDWDAEGIANAWADMQADGEGNCETCHNLGAEGFMASDQSLRVFDSITQIPEMMPSYFTLDATGTTVIINRTRLEKVGTRAEPHQEHGGFLVDGDPMQRLQRFYNLTAARLAAGLCDPPRF